MNHSKALGAILAAAISGFAATPLAAGAQAPPPSPGAGAGPMGAPPPGARRDRMPANDADFVQALSAANSAELNAGKYMVNRTSDPAVHAFAQRMIDDHSTAAVKLEAATRGSNVGPVPRDDAAQQAGAQMLARLQGEDGAARDADYMRMQVGAHRRVLRLLQWESDNGQIAGLKALAASLIQPVQTHLELAQTYLSAHNLSPYGPPPGGTNPNGIPRGTMPGGTPNNPSTGSNGGSTSGSNNGTNPSPMPSASPH